MNNLNQIKNPIVIKGDIFSDYLNCNSFHDSLSKKDFAKPDNESFNKFFNNDESSIKSIYSLNDSCGQILSKPIIHHNLMENLFPTNRFDFIKSSKEKNKNESSIINKDDIKKKNLFCALVKEPTVEDKKQKKLIMNRESAKKSRLKRKNYIENLEKQYILLKEEYIKIREEQKLNSSMNNLNNYLLSNDEQNKIKQNSNYSKKIKKDVLEKTNNLNDINLINQRKLMLYLLINQIDIMTPIKIKSFQNKYLKMQILDATDSIEVIKNKINMNLDIIIELYGMEIDNKRIPNLKMCDKNKSIAYQLFEYYNDIKSLINKFETLYNSIDNK